MPTTSAPKRAERHSSHNCCGARHIMGLKSSGAEKIQTQTRRMATIPPKSLIGMMETV